MKKHALLFLFIFPFFAFGQAWDYPVKPGTDEWRALQSHKEKVLMCQIPPKILNNCSTQELLDICLKYPLSFDFYAHNSIKEGVENVKEDFNGLRELFRRKDNFAVLQNRINSNLIREGINSRQTLESKGEKVYEYTIIESLLSFDDFINNASHKELILTMKEAQKILGYKLKNAQLFSNYSYEVSALFIGKSIKKTDPNKKFEKETDLFIETGKLAGKDVFQELINY